MDDSVGFAVLEAVQADLAAVWTAVVSAEVGDLSRAEQTVRDGMLAIGARLLEAGVAARGTGKDGPRRPGGCGAAARCEGYRGKQVQSVVGWITIRRAYHACAGCGQGHCPLDAVLGLERDCHSPGVRWLAWRFGGQLPLAQAAHSLAEATVIRLSASTMRTLTEAVEAQREPERTADITAAWRGGRPPATGVPQRGW